jgi:hypothetical protein
MATPYETFVNRELPRRPALLTFANTGYSGDPNDVAAPAIISSAPMGTMYIDSDVRWTKFSTTWLRESIGGGGGNWRSVADTTARDAIPTDQRVLGLEVWVYGGQRLYQLRDGITNSNWVEIQPTEGSLYVDATTGSDTNQGLVASPIKTLAEATRRSGTLGRTAVIYFAPGTYTIPSVTEIGVLAYNYSALTFTAQDSLIVVGSRSTLASFTVDHVTLNTIYATGTPGWTINVFKGKFAEFPWPGFPGWYYSGWVLSNTADSITVAISMDTMIQGEIPAPPPGETVQIENLDTMFTPDPLGWGTGIQAVGLVQFCYINVETSLGYGTALQAVPDTQDLSVFGCRFYGWGLGTDCAGYVYNNLFDHVSYAVWSAGLLVLNGDNVYLDGDVIARVIAGLLVLNHGAFHWQERMGNGFLIDTGGAIDDGTQGYWITGSCSAYVRLDGCCRYRAQYHPFNGITGHDTISGSVIFTNGPNCQVELIDSNLSTIVCTNYFRLGNTGPRYMTLAAYVAAGKIIDCGDGSVIADKNAAGTAEMRMLRKRRFAEESFFDSDVTVTGNVKTPNTVQFNTTPTVGTFAKGKLYYDDVWQTITLETGRDVTLQIGQESLCRVYNATGVQIADGKAVYLTGVYSSGNNVPTIALAIATSEATSFVFGVTTQVIPIADYGFVTVRGNVNGLNTLALGAAGSTLYLSDTIAGDLVSVRPYPPNYDIVVGTLLTSSATVGRVNVRLSRSYKLDDLVDVSVPSPEADQILKFNGSQWIPGTISGGSAAAGIDFFMDDTAIVLTSAKNVIEVNSLSKTPVVGTGEVVDAISVTAATSPVIKEAYLYNTALNRLVLDGGIWTFNTYASVSSVGGGRVSSIRRNLFKVSAGTGTVTITDLGAGTKTATALTGSPFPTGIGNADRTLCGYLQTPNGLYQITARADANHVTIAVPAGYTPNESAVAYSVWNYIGGSATPTVTSLTTNYILYSHEMAMAAVTTLATDKLGEMVFGISNNTTTVNFTHNGTNHYSNFRTPLITLHNNSAGLDGGTPGQYYHLTSAEYAELQAIEGGTYTGNLAIVGQLSNLIPATMTPVGAIQTVDWSLGQWQKLSLGSTAGMLTLTFINGIAGTVYTLQITQHAAVPVNITLPVACIFPDAIPPVMSQGVLAKDTWVFAYDGVYYETNVGQTYGR